MMKNITFTADEDLIRKAREKARREHRSLNKLFRRWLEESFFSEALSVGLETGYRWYDSLVVVSALKSGSTILYSEDLEHGRVLRGLRIINPFL